MCNPLRIKSMITDYKKQPQTEPTELLGVVYVGVIEALSAFYKQIEQFCVSVFMLQNEQRYPKWIFGHSIR